MPDLFDAALCSSDDEPKCVTPLRVPGPPLQETPSPNMAPSQIRPAEPPINPRPEKKPRGRPQGALGCARAAQQATFSVVAALPHKLMHYVLAPTHHNAHDLRRGAPCETCVPLWPLYSIKHAPADEDLGSDWVRLAHDQQWVIQLLQSIPAQSRQSPGALIAQLTLLLKAEIARCRQVDLERQNAASTSFKKSVRTSPTYSAAFQGVSVTLLSSIRPIYLKSDPHLITWIAGHFLPLCRKLEVVPPTSAPGLELQPRPKFSMPLQALQGKLRDKVTWEVQQHAWRVLAKKPRTELPPFTDLQGDSLRVSTSLEGMEYAEAKAAACARAIATWNAIDGTARQRLLGHDATPWSVVVQPCADEDGVEAVGGDDGSQPCDDDGDDDLCA